MEIAMSRLIIVSNLLPFSVERTEDDISVRQSSGGLVSALKSYLENNKTGEFEEIIWIGSSDLNESEWENTKDAVQNKDFRVEPVFIAKEAYDDYYNGFSNSTLWPLFHYFPSIAV